MSHRLAIVLAFAGVAASRSVAAEADPRGATAWALVRAAAAVNAYRASTGELPSSGEGIDGLVPDPAALLDGWGRPLAYVRVAGGFWLISLGADGAPGGTGDAEDLVQISR